METVSVDEAIKRGSRMVSWPVRGLLFIPASVMVLGRGPLEAALGRDPYSNLVLGSFAFGFVAAWLWWSIQAPKWRLWAYERVADIPELKRQAIAAQLIWPDGSFFSRTEIKSASHAARERELEAKALEGRAGRL